MVAQTKVFVGRLPEDAKPEDLRKLFERFGVVTECDIMNRCGFVHMETEEQAAAAIRELHNTTFNGGVITVERGRIKERGQRGGGRGIRGGMRGGMDRRGGMRGGMRDAPYPMRDRGMGPMRDRGMGHMRNSAPYDRSMDRGAMGGGGYDDRYNGYGGEDRRGFALMDNRGARDPYAAPPPMYADDRQGYGAPVDNMYPDERDMMDRRAPMRSAPMTMSAGYDRAPPRAAPMATDMYSRRSEQTMWGGAAAAGSYERDPYTQQYPNAGRSDGYGEGARDPYAAPAPMHAEDRQSYAAPVDGAYPNERDMVDRRAPVAPMSAAYPNERDMVDRRAPVAPMSAAYDRAPARAAPVPADAYSRKSEQAMWGDAAAAGSYERDPYAQQYPNAGRW